MPRHINPYCWTAISDVAKVDGICRQARSILEGRELFGHVFAVDLLLREFINNAIIHGNSSSRRKKVYVSLCLGRTWIRLVVRDEGRGFNWRVQRKYRPSEDDVSGRGLAIGTAYAEKMQFNRSGNQVTLWICKKARKDRTT